MEHKQHDKAVHLYVMGNRIGDAIDMCLQQKVIITDDLADKMTPAKPPKNKEDHPPGTDYLTKEKRVEVLMKLARVCKKQGSYHLATKKYTQAGDKLKAMKCLLKSGDTDKIIFFANVSRNRDIFILAANYLQNLDWHNNPATMKSIITFYTKAKAFEQLSSFYDACANVEIDEYRDYAKALGALNEAERYVKNRGVCVGVCGAVLIMSHFFVSFLFFLPLCFKKKNPKPHLFSNDAGTCQKPATHRRPRSKNVWRCCSNESCWWNVLCKREN